MLETLDKPIIPKVSIVISVYNMAHLIMQTVKTCLAQDYPEIELIIYDDCSTDGIQNIYWEAMRKIKFHRGIKNLGVGSSFNAAIRLATGDIIVLMCADDLFTCKEVIKDIVYTFSINPRVGHVSRWYHQFIDGDPHPVRAWRTSDIIVQANNPSGLAFRREALEGKYCSNKMFVETSSLVRDVSKDFWGTLILMYDTVAVRVHSSTSTQPGYWLKRRVSSPVMDWWAIGGAEIARDYVSFIQIKNGFKMSALWEEIYNFIKLRPANLLNPRFWFFAIVAVFTPRRILRKIPHWYRLHIGRRITKEVKRP
jgi:glycosyltransferase involved in cell wall biosynthesis